MPEHLGEPVEDVPKPRLVRRGGGVFIGSLWGLGERLTWIGGGALALSAFTGWYSASDGGASGDGGSGNGVSISVLGWHTGTLGKLVFVVGLALLALVALRANGIELPASIPESVLVLGLGSLATIFILVRAVSIPEAFFFAGRGIGLWISLASALVVIAAGLLQATEEL